MDTDTKSYTFAESLLPTEHTIFGITLRPFCLAHWAFLEDYGNPIISPQTYPEEISDRPDENYTHSLRHILIFILVCANTYEDNCKLVENTDYCNGVIKEYEEHIVKYINNTKHWNIYLEIYRIHRYLDYYINSMPYFVEKGRKSESSGIEWKRNLYDVLKTEYNYSESVIMNMNLIRVYAEWVTFAAKSGCIIKRAKAETDLLTRQSELAAKVRSGEVKIEGFNK